MERVVPAFRIRESQSTITLIHQFLLTIRMSNAIFKGRNERMALRGMHDLLQWRFIIRSTFYRGPINRKHRRVRIRKKQHFSRALVTLSKGWPNFSLLRHDLYCNVVERDVNVIDLNCEHRNELLCVIKV